MAAPTGPIESIAALGIVAKPHSLVLEQDYNRVIAEIESADTSRDHKIFWSDLGTKQFVCAVWEALLSLL